MFSFDPTKATAAIEVLPKGEYEFIVGTPKTFLRQAGEDKHDSYGVMYPLTVANGDKEGKKVFFSTYYHSEGGGDMAKRFIMPVLGYPVNNASEKQFNADQADKDWRFDPNDGTLGDAYFAMEGQRVVGELDVQQNKNTGGDQQNFKSWRPIG